MNPNIRWITPLYGFGVDCEHLGLSERARSKMIEMASELIDGGGLVAIYIPEGTQSVYGAGGACGRVVGAVRLLPIPSGKNVEDYFYDDWDGTRRWPIGWPCEVAYAPVVERCPALREHVEHLHGRGSFRGYVRRFQQGPFELDPVIRERLNRDFSEFECRA